jgi:nucleotide-binding universal stress UspA family protein
MGRIVVGVDGSEGSKAALAWALDEARLRQAALDVVCSYSLPTGWFGVGDTMGVVVATEITEDDVAGYAGETLTNALAAADADGVEITKTTIAGHPATALVAAADGADLLVVGSRGHGDFGSILLGSVGMHCVHHSPCPVVVVHRQKPAAHQSSAHQ